MATKKKRARRLRIFKITAVFALLACVVVAGYLFQLDRTVTKTFEGRRWSIPAQVYAQPLELFTGIELSQAELGRELDRLGYQRRSTLDVPGTYTLKGNRLHAHLRGFEFMDGYRDSLQLSASFAGNNLTALTTNGAPQVIVQLEPASIGSFFPSHGEDRVILPPEQVPELLREGLKLVEDRKFDSHHGFDLRGIFRALLVNLRAGKAQQGGSTLTQQLVKSYFLDNRRTYGRKLRELAMAIILEARFEKSDLLNAYINEIYLAQDGQRAIHGFGLGSQFYFNKPLAELDIHEIALLLTVIRGPSHYNPWRQPDRVRERRDRIISTLQKGELISEHEANTARRQGLTLAGATRPRGAYYPAFMDLVRRQLKTSYPAKSLATEGLRIFTTLKPHVQERLQNSATQTLAQLQVTPPPAEGPQEEQPQDTLQVAAMVTQSQTGDVIALLGGRTRGGFNRALKASRPIGSLVKPAVYLTALEHPDYHLASPIEDSQLTLPQPNGDIWTPSNFDEEEHGQVPLVRALADSLNLATVRLGLQIGVEKITRRMGDLIAGFRPNAYPSLLLGAVSMNVLQVGELYGNFASGGFHTTPTAVIAVLDEENVPISRYPLQTSQTIDSEANSQLVEAMKIAMSRGTGKRSALASQGVAGKTGTSNDFRDSWFAGFDAATLAVVWVGHDNNTPTGLTGSAGAMRVWDDFMASSRVAPLPAIAASQPNSRSAGLQTRELEYSTGFETTRLCSPDHDRVNIPVPTHIELERKPDCSSSARFGDRLRRWLKPE